jgi:hypothetical protein
MTLHELESGPSRLESGDLRYCKWIENLIGNPLEERDGNFSDETIEMKLTQDLFQLLIILYFIRHLLNVSRWVNLFV